MALLQRGHRRQLRGLCGQDEWHQHEGRIQANHGRLPCGDARKRKTCSIPPELFNGAVRLRKKAPGGIPPGHMPHQQRQRKKRPDHIHEDPVPEGRRNRGNLQKEVCR